MASFAEIDEGGDSGRGLTSPDGDGDDCGSARTPLDVVQSVLLIFLVGVAVLVGLVALLYAVALLLDRLCRCCGCGRAFAALHTDGPRHVQGGEVARDAGLSGITGEERRRVLERALGGQKPSQCEVEEVKKEKDIPSRSFAVNANGSQNSGEELLADAAATADLGADVEPHIPDSNAQCAICINEYEDGEQVTMGERCSHMFHRSCLLGWLDEHDVCPYCRKAVVSSEQMREAAEEVLGRERLLELAMGHPIVYYAGSHLAGDPVSALSLLPGGRGLEATVSSSSHDVEVQEDAFAPEENSMLTYGNEQGVSAELAAVDPEERALRIRS